MSGPFALAAVSAVLRRLLARGIGDVDLSIFGGAASVITLHPPDLVETGANELAQLNLYLYRVEPNAALRNEGLAARGATGERLSNPPLALDLHYLLTAYGAQELYPDALLGYGMQVLHEFPFLSRDFIRKTWPGSGADAVEQALAASGLADQIETIKITPEPLATEELAKLWPAFQAKLRMSACYRVTVVLIQASEAAKAPLPVLRQGKEGAGPRAVGSLVRPYPEIESLILPDNQPAALLGAKLTIAGHDFAGETGDKNSVTVTVRLSNDRWQVARDLNPNPIPPQQRDQGSVHATIPDDPAALPAGLYSLSVRVMPNGKPDAARSSNGAPLLLAPKITTPLPAQFAAGLISLTVSPLVQPGQQVKLILGTRELPAQPISDKTDTVSFDARDMAPGVYKVRLRVDGIDSLLVDRSDLKALKFDPSQEITIT